MKLKKILHVFLFVLAICLFSKNNVIAITSKGGYTIESYDIQMIVNENNTFDITETITANFSGNDKHGIFRKIPLINNIGRTDGSNSINRVKISNIQINDKYKSSIEGNYRVLKIGDSNKTISGRKTYVIKYRYNIGKDPLENVDELYFNLIGDEWDTSISNITFKVIMPKQFDDSTLGFSCGNSGSTAKPKGQYSVNGNTINGRLSQPLNVGQALTIRLTLPEGYFEGTSLNLDYITIIEIIISIVFVFISFTLWYKYGRNSKVIDTVEFYPPDNLNSAELAYVFKGECGRKEIISLLVYLASKGYLKIEEYKDRTRKAKYRFIKLKEYDGNNRNERVFFKGLFRDSDEVIRELDSLKNRFYRTISTIWDMINDKEERAKIFELAPSLKRKSMAIMLVVMFLFMVIDGFGYKLQSQIIGDAGTVLAIAVFVSVFILVILLYLYKTPKISYALVNSALMIGCGMLFMADLILVDKFYLMKAFIISVCIALTSIFLGLMEVRTKYGREMLGKIRGFKRFLKVAEKPQLEELLMNNPKYFYDILPYAYVLGVSKKWISRFEEIGVESPDWYGSEEKYNLSYFDRRLDDLNSSMYRTMTSQPESTYSDSSFSSGSSGGGYSGGGSGGGGGGSW